MTTHKDTAGIIERLEAASGPGRELDARIWWIQMSPGYRQMFDATGYISKVVEREWNSGNIFGLFYCSSDAPPDRFDSAPKYTSSIDAALSLVPEGWLLSLEQDHCRGSSTGFKWRCDLNHTCLDALDGKPFSAAPLAICATALRARSHKGEA